MAKINFLFMATKVGKQIRTRRSYTFFYYLCTAMQRLEKALYDLSPLLASADPNWCIFGSAALYLNGIQGIHVKDIDILMSTEGAKRAEQLLHPYLVPITEDPESIFRSRHSHYLYHDVIFDISGDLEVIQNHTWIPVCIADKRFRQDIPYASLEDCIRLFQLFGRPKDLEKLSWLSRNDMLHPHPLSGKSQDVGIQEKPSVLPKLR